MATKPYRQNLTGAQGTTLTGAHGGVQQLGAAAQRRLQTGQPGAQPTQPPAQPPPGARTPPPFDPATLKPGAGRGDPSTGGIAIMPGAPGTAVPPGGAGGVPGAGGPFGAGRLPLPIGDMMTMDGRPGAFPGGAPGIASMDGMQNGQAGPAGMFGRAGQQLGVQDPSAAGNIDNAISSLRSQLGMTGPGGSGGAGGPSMGPVTNYGPTNVDGGFNMANPSGQGAGSRWARGEMEAMTGGMKYPVPPGVRNFGDLMSYAAQQAGGAPGGKPLPNGGAAGIAQQQQQQPGASPYANLLRQRLASFGGGGLGPGTGAAARTAAGAAMGGLRGY